MTVSNKLVDRTVLIADDHDLIRLALHKIFEQLKGYRVVAEAKDHYELLTSLRLYHPDILLLDLNMPGKSGFELVGEVRDAFPDVKIIILTVDDSPYHAQKAFEVGVFGYLLKENATEELQIALGEISKGKSYASKGLMTRMLASGRPEDNVLNTLSQRELEVLYLMSTGKSNKEIGEILFLSEKTVRNYSTTLFRKLDVDDRLGATILAIKNHIEEIMGTNVPMKSGHT